MNAQLDSIPIYNEHLFTGWLIRSNISYYNMHVNLGLNTYRVGEFYHPEGRYYIFDRGGFQWAETSQIPYNLNIE